MDITQLLGNVLTKDSISKISSQIGLDEGTTGNIAKKALPMLLKQLGNNAKDSEKSVGLEKALDGKKVSNEIDLADGSKMLQHMFDDTSKAEEELAQEAGTDTKNSKNVLSALAPMLMGAVGEGKSQGLDMSSLGGILEGASKNSLVVNFLDSDKDGDIKDDVMKMGMNFMKKFISGKK